VLARSFVLLVFCMFIFSLRFNPVIMMLINEMKPADSLISLLANLPADLTAQAVDDAAQIPLFELAALVADMHAQQAVNTLRNLLRLFPCLEHSDAKRFIIQPAMALLIAQEKSAQQIGLDYRAQLAQLRARYPHIAGAWNVSQNSLNIYLERHHYPLGRLLQALPDNITAQASLRPEQVHACAALSALAEHASQLAWEGIATIETLLAIAKPHTAPEQLPEVGKLIRYLQQEARFNAQNASEYWDAALHLPCIEDDIVGT
jgi:hypothetical protein